jgi:preprotein translocase subunit SecG
MYGITVFFHVLACLALILIVLLQTGKGAEMGAAFGGASQTLFGGSGGTTFLGKLTTGAAIAFMITCMALTYLSAGTQTKSVMQNVPVEKSEAPLLPEAKPIQPGAEQPAAPAVMPKPEAGAAPVSPENPAAQAQEPAKEEKKAAPPAPKPQEKRQQKPPAGPAGAKRQ